MVLNQNPSRVGRYQQLSQRSTFILSPLTGLHFLRLHPIVGTNIRHLTRHQHTIGSLINPSFQTIQTTTQIIRFNTSVATRRRTQVIRRLRTRNILFPRFRRIRRRYTMRLTFNTRMVVRVKTQRLRFDNSIHRNNTTRTFFNRSLFNTRRSFLSIATTSFSLIVTRRNSLAATLPRADVHSKSQQRHFFRLPKRGLQHGRFPISDIRIWIAHVSSTGGMASRIPRPITRGGPSHHHPTQLTIYHFLNIYPHTPRGPSPNHRRRHRQPKQVTPNIFQER